MEVRTQAVDRLLEALAPSLAVELDRLMLDFRQELEGQFQSHLQTSLRDAELETLHLAEVRLEEAVIEARETMRIQLSESFTEQLQYALEQQRVGLQAQQEVQLEALKAKSDEDMQTAFANWAAERYLLQDELNRWHAYAEAQRQLSECTSQPEILSQFLKLSDPFAESLAIYIAKPGGLALWKARGNGAFPELISPDTIDPDLYFKPAVVRDTMVAAVCAVRPCKVESLDFLMSCFERAIESFGLKLRTRGPRPPAAEADSGA